MVGRTDSKRIETKVKTACAESGFYSIPTQDVDESARENHDPELVEKILSQIESGARVLVDRILARNFPLAHEDKFQLSLFLATGDERLVTS